MLNVTSFFLGEAQKKSPKVLRRFTIGSSDYSAYVTKWPKISRKWNDMKIGDANVALSNESKQFNFLKANVAAFYYNCKIEVGFESGSGTTEYTTVFDGELRKAMYRSTKTEITIENKFKRLGERTIGDRDTPVNLSARNPWSLTWELLTTYGGLSDIASSSNPDIDYDALQAWGEVFSGDSVEVVGYFDGQKVTEALRTVGRITASSVFEEAGKLKFARYTVASEQPFDITAIKNISLEIDDSKIVNHQAIYADYNVDSSEFGVFVNDETTASVNSFGLRQDIEDSKKVWYTNSGSAINFCQRITSTYAEPFNKYTLDAPLQPLGRTIGDTVTFSHQHLDEGGDTYRVMGYEIDIDKCEMKLNIDATQLITPFVLDDAVNGLLDESYNPLG